MDEDGDTDVLGAAFFGDDITWWENTDGTGLNWYEHLIEGNFDGATDVATADMDGDGDPDIIGAAHEDSDITWWNVTCCVGAGELVSSILDTETAAQWDSINWASDEPSGTSIYFQVRCSTDPMYMGSWSTDIIAPGSLENYLINGDRYVQYKVFLETNDPGLSPVLEDVTISWSESVGIDDENNLTKPAAFRLISIYPNPFTTSTTIEYQLNQPSQVTLTIYNHLGEQIDLIRQHQHSGKQQITWNAVGLPPGMYFFTLKAGDQVATGKMVLIR
jgi:hypothetical protein